MRHGGRSTGGSRSTTADQASQSGQLMRHGAWRNSGGWRNVTHGGRGAARLPPQPCRDRARSGGPCGPLPCWPSPIRAGAGAGAGVRVGVRVGVGGRCRFGGFSAAVTAPRRRSFVAVTNRRIAVPGLPGRRFAARHPARRRRCRAPECRTVPSPRCECPSWIAPFFGNSSNSLLTRLQTGGARYCSSPVRGP